MGTFENSVIDLTTEFTPEDESIMDVRDKELRPKLLPNTVYDHFD